MERPIKLYFIVTRFAIVKIHVAGNKQLGSQVVLARTPNQSALHNVNVEQRKKLPKTKKKKFKLYIITIQVRLKGIDRQLKMHSKKLRWEIAR